MGISSPGIGSGLDINGLITKLILAERTRFSPVEARAASLRDRLSVYGKIKSNFAAFQDIAKKLSALGTNTVKQTNSDSTILTASGGANAAGTYNINVSQLANAQSVKSSNTFASGNTQIASLGSGGNSTFTIDLGSYSGNTFTATSSKTITFSGSGSNLFPNTYTVNDLVNGINNANAGVTASLVPASGGGVQVQITSNATGANQAFRLTASDARSTSGGDNTTTTSTRNTNNTDGFSQFAYDPANNVQNSTLVQAATDAVATVNGTQYTSSTNNFTGAGNPNLSFFVKAVGTDNLVISNSVDNTAIKASIKDFVASYNTLVGNLKENQKKGTTLDVESTPFRLEKKIRDIFNTDFNGTSIMDLGLTISKDGVLSFNDTKYDSAVASDISAASKVFGNSLTSTDPRVTFVRSTSATVTGTYAVNVSQAYNSTNGTSVAGTIGGTSAVGTNDSLVGTSGNISGLEIKIQEGASGNLGSITYTEGLGSLIGDFVDQINADGGALKSRTDGITRILSDLDKDKARFEDSIERKQALYLKQFTALDGILSKFQELSASITQRLG